MSILTKPSSTAGSSLKMIVIGAILAAWSVTWYMYLSNSGTGHLALYYVCGGLVATGLILTFVGFGVGWIARSARQAELPPEEVTPEALHTEAVAAARGVPNPVAGHPPAGVPPVAPPTPAGVRPPFKDRLP